MDNSEKADRNRATARTKKAKRRSRSYRNLYSPLLRRFAACRLDGIYDAKKGCTSRATPSGSDSPLLRRFAACRLDGSCVASGRKKTNFTEFFAELAW